MEGEGEGVPDKVVSLAGNVRKSYFKVMVMVLVMVLTLLGMVCIYVCFARFTTEDY